MKNVILIDLTMFNYDKLVEVAKLYNIDSECLVSNKKAGFSKVWFDTVSGSIIAYSVKEFKDNIFIAESFISDLGKIRPVEMIKQPKVLDVDVILDKISKYGVESLNESEKDFLKK